MGSVLQPTLPAGGPYVFAFFGFGAVIHTLEQYLELRQLRKNRVASRPAELEELVDEATFVASQAYQKDSRLFGFVKDNVGFVEQAVHLFFLSPTVWKLCEGYVGADREYAATLLWLLAMHYIDKPLGIAFSLYSHFVIEEKHGFNKMTLRLYVADLLKGELITLGFGGALIPLVIWIVRRFKHNSYIWLWAFCQVLTVGMLWIYPNFIQPLFNKYEQLKDEVLYAKIVKLANSVQFPLTKLFQVDGSKRSAHSNAYIFGFWKWKRIVLYDTLLHLEHDGVLAILCHELGHWKLWHSVYNLAIANVHMFILFFLFGHVMFSSASAGIIRDFGYGDTKAVAISLVVFTSLYSPTEQLLSLMMTALSRTHEFQADAFACGMGHGATLRQALIKLQEENKSDYCPDWLYSWYHYSHPALIERTRALVDAPNGPAGAPNGPADAKKEK